MLNLTRLGHDMAELHRLSHLADGLKVLSPAPETPPGTYDRIQLALRCISATASQHVEPVVAERVHCVTLYLPANYPLEPVRVTIVEPSEVFHPNVAGPMQIHLPNPIQAMLRLAGLGLVCYSHYHTPQQTLAQVVRQVYDLLGYRMGRWSRQQNDCLNPAAVAWANQMEAQGRFPLERRPLVAETAWSAIP